MKTQRLFSEIEIKIKQSNYQMVRKHIITNSIYLLLMNYIQSGKAHLFNNLGPERNTKIQKRSLNIQVNVLGSNLEK